MDTDRHNKLSALHFDKDCVEDIWASFRDSVHNSSLDILGPTERKHQDWFDENDKNIQTKKHMLQRAHVKDPN